MLQNSSAKKNAGKPRPQLGYEASTT